jgi:hypothetical protein
MTFALATISTAKGTAQQKKATRSFAAVPNGGISSNHQVQKPGQSSSASSSPAPTSDGRLATGAMGTLSRPKSPARTPISRSRDIVQEVYDRMGVNYVRGQSTYEFDDSKGSLLVCSGTKNAPKPTSLLQRRYMLNPDTEENVESDAKSTRSSVSTGRNESRWSSSRSVSTHFPSHKHPVVAYPPSTKSVASLTYHDDGSFPNRPRPTQQLKNQSPFPANTRNNNNTSETRDDMDNRESREDIQRERDGREESPISVKSRITAIGGHARLSGANTKTPFRTSSVTQKKYATAHMKSKMSGSRDYSSGVKGRIHNNPITSLQRSLQSEIADCFLASINKQSSSTTRTIDESTSGVTGRPSDLSTKSIPAEIRPSDPNNPNCDDHSLAASSVSGEDFTTGGATFKQESSFDKVIRKDTMGSSSTLLTKEMIDQMMEEKLQTKFVEIYTSLESIIRQVEHNTNARLNDMDKKLDAWMTTTTTTTTTHRQNPEDPIKDSLKGDNLKGDNLKGDNLKGEDTSLNAKSSSIKGSTYYRPFRR